MDREAFFQALPFLAPVSSRSEWPPPNGSSCNVILQDYLLSIEPSAAGPACFATSANDGQDAAMFSIDICLLVSEKQHPLTSPASSSVSTSLSLSQTSKHASQEGHEQSKNPQTHVVIRIDKKLVLQVDLSLLVAVQVHEKPVVHPHVPHLLLQFDTSTFRLFSQEALDETTRESEGSSGGNSTHVEPLQTVAARLKKVTSAFEKRVVLPGNELHLLPMDEHCTESSATNKTVQQQQQRGESDKEHSTRDTNTTDKSGIQQKKSSLKRSWDALQALQTVLDMPYDTASQEEENEDIMETISPVLNTAATELASSYSRKSEVRNAIQSCTHEILSCETQLNNVFTAAFPPPTRNRRHTSPAKPTTTAPPAPPQHQEEDVETLLATAQTLLDKQKAAMKERLELFLLPTRG